MLALYILSTIILVAIVFLIYCYVGFTRAQSSRGAEQSISGAHTGSFRHWKVTRIDARPKKHSLMWDRQEENGRSRTATVYPQ